MIASLRKAAQKYIRFRMYFGRGMSYVGDIKQLFYFAIGFKLFGFDAAQSAALAAVCGLLVFLAGYFDIHRLKIMQFEAELLTNYNPVLRDIHKRVKK